MRPEFHGIGIREQDDIASGLRQTSPHRVTFAQRRAKLRGQRRFAPHFGARGPRQFRRAVVGVRIDDQLLVVDADSDDGTAELARAAGAEVWSESALAPEFGPALGKGDAMWRSLTKARGDIILFADADTVEFRTHLVTGILGPLLLRPAVQFVKAAYTRPFTARGERLPGEGGRVTELTARPLLNLFFPELAGFVQPLAGEFGAWRHLLEAI